ncbi:MAG: putative Iron-sulfur cluster carrier protein [Candidatus Thorarchaeota archaeon]|nr:MAG: putative Iron-sulfur cluster carrier protein [Candidatus Thorarchaeota archaeon]
MHERVKKGAKLTTITVHGFKGGTGKSLIAIALGYLLSKQGKKVLLIDGDYFAPCFDAFFPQNDDVNPFTEYLEEKSKFEEVVAETRFPNLWVSYAPTPSFTQKILQADTKTHGGFLKRIYAGIKIARDDLGFDHIVIDNSSGISLAAINFLTCSNQSLLVIRPVRYGVESTYNLISAIYRKLRYADSKSVRRDFLVWNQVPTDEESIINPDIERYLNHWTDKFSEAGIQLGSRIPYISEVVTSMIVDSTLDIEKISKPISNYMGNLIKLLG